MEQIENNEKEKNNEKTNFVVRIILWALFSCVIPVVFIGWRYNLFSKVGGLQLSGWGLIAIVIIFVFLYVVVKYIRAGFIEWSMTKQIINGICRVVIPLGALLLICISLKNNLDIFIQALSCVLVSEIIAIPLNPFPKWVWEKSQGRFENTIDFIANRFYDVKKDKEKE